MFKNNFNSNNCIFKYNNKYINLKNISEIYHKELGHENNDIIYLKTNNIKSQNNNFNGDITTKKRFFEWSFQMSHNTTFEYDNIKLKLNKLEYEKLIQSYIKCINNL